MKRNHVQTPLPLLAFWIAGTLVFIVIALFCILGLLHKVSQRQLMLFSQGIVESSVQQEQTISSSVKDVFDSASLDPALSKLLNYEAVQPNELLQGLRQLKMYRETNYLVDSIYIFNYRNQTVYVSSPNAIEAVYPIEDFFDPGAASLIQSYQNYSNMQPIFRSFSSTYPSVETVSLISYLRYNTLAPAGQSNVMIINIRQEVLFERLNTVSMDMGTTLLLVNREGVLETVHSAGEYRSVQQIVEKVLRRTDEEGCFIDGTDRSEHIVCYQPILNNEWILISISSESSLNSLFKNNEYILSLFLLILLFAFCCVGGIVVIRKLGEVSNLNRQKIAQMEQERREKAYESKRQAIRSFLHTTGREAETLLPLQKQGYSVREDTYGLLLILFLDHYSTQIPEQYVTIRDRNALKFGICNIAEELLTSFGVSFSTYEEDARCVILLQPAPDSDSLLPQLRDLQHKVREGLNVSLSIFLSAPFPLMQTTAVYEGLCNGLPYRQLLGAGSIITSDMLDFRELYSCNMPTDQLKQLSQEILRLDMSQALLRLREILESISQGSYKSFQVNLVQLIVCLDETLTKLQVNNGIEKAIHAGTLMYRINSLESLEEICLVIEEVLQQTEKRILQNQGSHQQPLFTSIQEIVRKGYADRDFSINTVADRLGMSPAYLSRVFKKSTGTTFVEYVLAVRMDAARNLLSHTDTPIDEIVTAVGFSDISYFYKVFKKVNGCTPAIYRKNHHSDAVKYC